MTNQTAPNILFILVDEMRYPMHFPAGISSADQFLQKFMPHTYRLLWQPSVRFRNAYTAASDCTPARGTIVTGLYAQQTFCMTTRANKSHPQSEYAIQPPLHPAYPTYGKLLRAAGYDTPYIGKWHLSNFPDNPNVPYLEEYGFDGLTRPDPVSLPGQGFGATPAADDNPMPFGDPQVANQAVTWLHNRAKSGTSKPFCLTVGFTNPHDKQFFWGGIEVSRYQLLYGADTPPLDYTTNIVHQAYPPAAGYSLPLNWQTRNDRQIALHQVFREFFAGAVGDTADNPGATQFTTRPSSNPDVKKIAVAPYTYWIKGQDMYTQAMNDVDEQIAQVIENIPDALRDNTVIVFTSDHGEYAGAHGLQGKGFTAYEETMRVPLTFTDLTRRYTAGNADRYQFASSVDLLPLFASLAYGGDSWIDSEDLRWLYGNRNDLLNAIRTNQPVIRNYAVFTCDEVMTATDNYLDAPGHVLAFTDGTGKLGLYSRWASGKATPLAQDQQVEYYDYNRPNGRLEMVNQPSLGSAAATRLLNDILPNELQRPLPTPALREAQQEALARYWQYVDLANTTPETHRPAHML